MRAPPRNHNALDRGVALHARLVGALVDAMLKLEESPYAVGVHIVRDRGTAQLDRVLKHDQRKTQSLQFPAAVSRPACLRGRIPARKRLSSA